VKIENSTGRPPSRAVLGASIALVILIWAVNFIAAKIGLRSLPAATLASFRVVLAGAVMIPFYLVCSRLPAFAETAETRRRGLTLGDLWTFLYMGFFGVTVNQICFTVGLRYTSVSHASVIVGMGPIYTLIFAVLLKLEAATWRKAIGMVIALAGIAFMASENGISTHLPSLLGDAITMTGSIGFAMYMVLGKRLGGRYDPLTMTAFSHYAGALMVSAGRDLSCCYSRLFGALAGRRLERLGRAALYGDLQFGSCVCVLLLAAAIFAGFPIERLYVSAARRRNSARDSVARRKRLRGPGARGSSSSERRILDRVWPGICRESYCRPVNHAGGVSRQSL